MDRRFAARRFVQQRRNGDRRGTADTEIVRKVVQRNAAVENVLDEDDVASLDVLVQILVDLHRTGSCRLVAIG